MQPAALFHDDRKPPYILNHTQHLRVLQRTKPAAQETAIETLKCSEVLMTSYVRKYVPF